MKRIITSNLKQLAIDFIQNDISFQYLPIAKVILFTPSYRTKDILNEIFANYSDIDIKDAE